MKNSFDHKLFQMAEAEKMVMQGTTEQKIEEVLEGLPQKKRRFHVTFKRAVLLTAVLTLLCSATVTASVGILRERLENMNREKLEQFFVQLYTSKAPADNYNRYLTEEENARKEKLTKAYSEQGLFPEGEIYLIEEPSDYKGKKVAYLPDTGTFFFPEKEMSDEEILQYIDFLYKRDYSLQKVNELIADGEMEFPEEALKKEEVVATDASVLNSAAVWNPGQELTIPYEGEVSVTAIAAGRDRIYLGGWGTVHTMAIGGSESELFFDEFEKETQVTFIYEDSRGNVYIAGAELETEEAAENPDYMPPRSMALWKVNAEGDLLQKINLSVYANAYGGIVEELLIDDKENIYVIGLETNRLHVLSAEGKLLSEIDGGEYRFNNAGGMGIGKDGKAYVTVYEPVENGRRLGIATIDVEKECLEEIYMGIVPEGTIMLDIIAQGAETDFVFWGYDGIFTYNLGENAAVHVMSAYEMPCEYEAAPVCGLKDGRILIAACNEYKEEKYGNGWNRYLRVPGQTCFYYLSPVKE